LRGFELLPCLGFAHLFDGARIEGAQLLFDGGSGSGGGGALQLGMAILVVEEPVG